MANFIFGGAHPRRSHKSGGKPKAHASKHGGKKRKSKVSKKKSSKRKSKK
jgi:hypothetical protein